MRSFTAQAGIADINNSASLVKGIMTMPTSNDFLKIKLPENLQSENSTDNALKRLKMRTEETRMRSIEANDKLAGKKVDMLKAKYAFEEGMSNKEFGLKQSQFEFDKTMARNRDNRDEIRMVADINLAGTKHADDVMDKERRYNLDREKHIDFMQNEGWRLQNEFNKATSEKERNQAQQDLAKHNLDVAKQKKLWDEEDRLINQDAMNQTVDISRYIDGIKEPKWVQDKTITETVNEKKYDFSNAEADYKKFVADLDAELNMPKLTDDVKDFLEKKKEIEQLTKIGSITKGEAQNRIRELAKNVKFKNSSGELQVLNDPNANLNRSDIYLKESEAFKKKYARELQMEKDHPSIFGEIVKGRKSSSAGIIPTAINLFGSVIPNIKKSITATELSKADKIAMAEMQKERNKLENRFKKSGILYDSKKDIYSANMSFLKDKVKKAESIGEIKNKKIEEWSKNYTSDPKKVQTIQVIKTKIKKDQLLTEQEAGLLLQTGREDEKNKIRSLYGKIDPNTGRPYTVVALNGALTKIDEKFDGYMANYIKKLASKATVSQSQREHLEKIAFEQEKSRLKKIEDAAKAKQDRGLQEVKNKGTERVAEINKSSKKK